MVNTKNISLMPPDKRAAAIAKAVRATKRSVNVPFRDKYVPVPVVSVPIGLPVYRADNGRLAALEANYVSRHGVDADYFLDNQDTPEAQAILHGFLSALAERSEGPIKDALARAGQQIEPLLVTVEGVVVNGNRRLAAMRDLLAANAKTFAGFETCEVAILPADATRADIEFIEAELQLAPETKLAYGWIDRRLKLRHQRDVLGLPSADIVRHYHLHSAESIETELGELELAEGYLRDFLKTSHDYDRVDWAEEPFVQLRRRLERFRNRDIARIVKLIGFHLIKAAAADEGLRPIKLFPIAEHQAPFPQGMLLNRLGGELGLWPPRSDEDSVRMPAEPDLAKLREALSEGEKDDGKSALVTKTIRDVAVEYESYPSAQIVVQRLRQVMRLATRIEPRSLTRKQRGEIVAELHRIRGVFDIGDDGDNAEVADNGGVLVNVAHSLEDAGKSILREMRKTREK